MFSNAIFRISTDYSLMELPDLTTIWRFFLQQTWNKKGHDGNEALKFKTDEKQVIEKLDFSVPASTRC